MIDLGSTQLKVTENHPVLINNLWMPSNQLKIGTNLGGQRIVGIKNITENVRYSIYTKSGTITISNEDFGAFYFEGANYANELE